MKKILGIAVLFMAALTFSCSSDSDGGSGEQELFIKFKVNGTQYTYGENDVISTESLTFSVQNNPSSVDNFTSLILNMPVNKSVGNHTIVNSGDLETTYQASYGTDDINVDGIGTLTITSMDDEYIEGTFSFAGNDTTTDDPYAITEGSFRAYNITD